MVLGDVLIGYLFMWFISKLAAAEKEAEKEFREPRAKLWEHDRLKIVPVYNVNLFTEMRVNRIS